MVKERAIELLKNFNLYDEPNCMGYWDCDECVEELYMGIEAIKEQPKRGKWKQAEDIEKEYAVCTNCKHHGEFYMDYCPNCGARMEVEE